MTGIDHKSGKRASWDFYAMIKCGTGCNPLIYKGKFNKTGVPKNALIL